MLHTKVKEELVEEGVTSGVEQEEETFKSHEPFDPASISLSSKVVALDTVLRRIRNGTIVLNPDFQRNYVWDSERKSLLIESMMLRIPLPMFYVSEDKDGIWEVVDGLQRLTTIRDFILGPDGDGKGFSLRGLEFWGDIFDGNNFFTIEKRAKMPRIINNIMEAELSFTIINPDTPEKVKRNIFKRINTGGMRLSSQEIRHALYQGEATELLKEMVSTTAYKKFVGKTVKDGRMAGRELVLRFLSFYLRERKSYKGDMDAFLSDTMRFVNGDLKFEDVRRIPNVKVLADFDRALERANILFGEHAFRRSKGRERKTPINKSLFDVWTYCLAKINVEWFNKIIERQGAFEAAYYALLENDSDFSDSIGRYGGDLAGVRYRFDRIISLLRSIKND
ncbi:DUF262 domain-containing protein [Massilia litorea]|uniref:DUF262 domain-containing protein n=1 Tax=Massilia litorea TaxID=2769491 RepID=A0A7L9U2D7_9BURK|nr:DUF262 domain-containing protein [Massilia litorea]QOL48452.1 DUF262 domain-containing protein [Massilia litorea]